MKGVELAVYRPREAGEIRRIELDRGRAAVTDGGNTVAAALPPLTVDFEVPDGLKLAIAEAAASEAMSIIRQAPGYLSRYGMDSSVELTDQHIGALSRVVTAVETAVVLFKDWNFAEMGPGGPVKVPLTPENIARVMADSNLRAAWLIHLDAASPMERAEGNASAASPDTSSGGAADTAEGA